MVKYLAVGKLDDVEVTASIVDFSEFVNAEPNAEISVVGEEDDYMILRKGDVRWLYIEPVF